LLSSQVRAQTPDPCIYANLQGVYFTGGSLNPARSFGPCVALRTFPGYHWIYWLGPLMGSCIAVGFYRFIKALEYETANPGQDFNEKEAEVFNPDEDPARAADVTRPNVVVGRSEYIADQHGIHRSRDVLADSSTLGGPGSARPPARYDGEGNLEPPKEELEEDEQDHDHLEAPTNDRFRHAPDAENGNLGGSYRVSGLR